VGAGVEDVDARADAADERELGEALTASERARPTSKTVIAGTSPSGNADRRLASRPRDSRR
jgi:hypothetical protein